MPIDHPFVFIVGNAMYRLDRISKWWEPVPQKNPPVIHAVFVDSPDCVVVFDKVEFETAMQNAINYLY